jgi:hypothetical protein
LQLSSVKSKNNLKMKNTFTLLTTKLFLTGAICIVLISSCKKVEVGVPLVKPVQSRGVLPPPAVIINQTNTVTPTGTHSVTPTETTTETPVTNTVTPTTLPPVNNSETPPVNNSENPPSSCPAVTYPIWAGAGGNDTLKGTKVGSVSYTNDGVNLYVTSTFPGPTCPTEIAVWAGSDPSKMPKSNGGVPFGQFPYQLPNATCGTHTFTIPLSSLFPAGTNLCSKNIYIVLHAAMGADTSVDGSTAQTAIGYGSQTFGGPRWGWIATYPVCCSR